MDIPFILCIADMTEQPSSFVARRWVCSCLTGLVRDVSRAPRDCAHAGREALQAVTNFGLRCYEDLFHTDGAVDTAKIDALLGQPAPESPAAPRTAMPQVLVLEYVRCIGLLLCAYS